jgi:transcriptional regulator with XRE-family HTH domain
MPAFSGRALREHRKAAGQHVGQLADLVGRSPYTIIEYEAGRCLPTVPVVGHLADALRIPVCCLFEGGAADGHRSAA